MSCSNYPNNPKTDICKAHWGIWQSGIWVIGFDNETKRYLPEQWNVIFEFSIQRVNVIDELEWQGIYEFVNVVIG